MLADPQSITIGSSPGTVSLPATTRASNLSAYTSSDGTVVMTPSHQKGKRNRHTFRVDFSKIAPDPLVSANNIKYSASAYIVVDEPITGFDRTELKDLVLGLIGNVTASTDANLIAWLGGQS